MKSLAHGLLAFVAIFAALNPSARADEPLRIAVVEARKVTLPSKLGEQPVRTAGASGAHQADAEVVDAGRAGAACADEACWARVARTTGASHVLFVDAAYGRLSYKLSIVVWSAADHERRTPATAECTTCPAKDMLAKITELSEQVVSAEKARRPPLPRPAEIAVPAPPVPAEPRHPPIAVAPTVSTAATGEPSERGGSRVLAYSLVGGGTVMVLGSVMLFARDGHQSRCERDPAGGASVCLDTTKTKVFAVPLAAVGVGAIVWGGIEWWRTREPRVAVAVGPSMLVISGSF